MFSTTWMSLLLPTSLSTIYYSTGFHAHYLRHEILLSVQNHLLIGPLIECRADGIHFFLIGRLLALMHIRQRGKTYLTSTE